MMKYVASIDIMPLEELPDPQGNAIARNLERANIHNVEKIRIGKHIEMTFEAETLAEAEELVEEACHRLLANTIAETFIFTIMPETLEQVLTEEEE